MTGQERSAGSGEVEVMPDPLGLENTRADRIENAFTVDVEEHFQVAALKEQFPPSKWDDQRSRVVANTERVMGLLDSAGVQGTFFVLGWVAERNPQLVRDIVSAGHELACHGYGHQLIYEQDRETFRQETIRAKSVLEDTAGTPIRGYRAASYSITPSSSWALDIIAETGFEYDSSVVPVRHDIYGFSNAPALPHILRLECGASLMEFPPSTVTLAGRRVAVGGGGYFRIFPYWFSKWALGSLNKDLSPFSFYIHPWEVDPDQPRVKTNWKSSLRHYTNLSRCEGRLRTLLDDFRFGTMESVLRSLQVDGSLPVYDLEARRWIDDCQ